MSCQANKKSPHLKIAFKVAIVIWIFKYFYEAWKKLNYQIWITLQNVDHTNFPFTETLQGGEMYGIIFFKAVTLKKIFWDLSKVATIIDFHDSEKMIKPGLENMFSSRKAG